MTDEKWKEYLSRMPREYNDRGPGAPVNFDANDPALPISPVNMQVLEKCKTVVDLGCGVGRAIKLLKDKGKTVKGITCNEQEIKSGIEKYGLTAEEIILGDMHDTPFASNGFDGAISWESLEHAISPIILLWECNRLLVPGGILLLFLPNKVYVDADVHIVNLNVGQTKALLTKAGFVLQDLVDYTGDSARYVASKCNDIDKEWLKKHNKEFPIRSWTELVEKGK